MAQNTSGGSDPYPELNLERMKREADRNQMDHSNLSNPELNRIDREQGSNKGGC